MPHDARVTTKTASLPTELNSATSTNDIIAPRARNPHRTRTKAGIISAFSLATLATFGSRTSNATPVTYQFTGTVTTAIGTYSSLAVGTAVAGTYTIDYANANPSQSTGTLGSSTATWNMKTYGSSSTALPTTFILYTTSHTGPFTYVTNPSIAKYFAESTADGTVTSSPPQESSLTINEESYPDANDGQFSQLSFQGNGSNALWSNSGLPFTSGASGIDGSFQTIVNGSTSRVTFTVTSLTLAPPVKSLGDPQCACGDPINVATGNVYETLADYTGVAEGGSQQNRLTFERFYNSASSLAYAETFAKALATNWRSNYDRYLGIVTLNGSVAQVNAERADGQVLTFTLNGSGGYTSDTDVDVTLTQSGSTWTLTDHNETVETYNDLGTGEALLTSIKARDGYAQNLTYNGSNQLTTVTDSYNRSLTLTYYSNGLLDTVTTPGGLVMTYAYTSSGTNGTTLDQLASVTYSGNGMTPATKTYTYGDSSFPFALTSITDENNHVSNTWTYDSQGRGTSSQRATVGTQQVDLTTVAYNADGTVTVTNPLGETETYTFSTLQNVPKVTQISRAADGSVTAATETIGYDSSGYVNKRVDWNGNETDITNDSHGDPTSITEASGTSIARTTTIAYGDASFPQLPTTITEPTRETTLAYDANGNVLTKTVTDTTVTPNVSRTETYTYNGTGEMLTAKGPRTDVNQTTTMTYDGSGNLSTTTDALSHVTNFTSYDADGRLKSMSDPNGLVTNLSYDTRGNLLTRAEGTTALGFETTTLTRDAAENITSVTKPDGSVLTYTLDAANRVTKVTDSLNEHIDYTLDAAGNRTAVNVYDSTGTLNRTHTYAFDALSRMTSDTGAYSGETTSYTYDNNGNLLSKTDPLNDETQYAYDALNRVETVTDPLSHAVTITYGADTQNLISQVVTSRGVTTQYVRDGFGEVTELLSPDSGRTDYTYDSAGNVKSKLDANGNLTTYTTYDALNRLKVATYQDGTQSFYYYDSQTNAIGHLKQIADPTAAGQPANNMYFQYDIHGRVISKQTYGIYQTSTRSFSPTTGQLTSETYPSGMVVSYSYDAAGQMSGLGINGSSMLTNVTHEPFGPASGWTWATGSNTSYTRSFDLDGRLTSYPLDGTHSRTVGYDLASRVDALTDTAASQIIGYDAKSEITSYTGPYGNGNETLTYDADGNRLTLAVAAGTATYTIDPASNILTQRTTFTGGVVTYPRDADGSALGEGNASYTYDNRERMSSTAISGAGQANDYLIDGEGMRVHKTGTAGTVNYAWGIDHRMLGEYNGLNAVNYETVVLDGILPVAATNVGKSTVTPAQMFRAYAGNLSEPRRLIDNSGNLRWSWDSDPFGNGFANQNPSGLGNFAYYPRFPGQYFSNENNLHYNGARNYAPNTGRYFESDPVGLSAGINTYSYVLSDPANAVDPKGFDGESITEQFTQAMVQLTDNPAMQFVGNHPNVGWYLMGGGVGFVGGGLAADACLVREGAVFGTRYAGNTPWLNSASALRIGWSQFGEEYTFRIGGELLKAIKPEDPHITLWPPKYWFNSPVPPPQP